MSVLSKRIALSLFCTRILIFKRHTFRLNQPLCPSKTCRLSPLRGRGKDEGFSASKDR
jgi:hypothetical protein